MREKIAPISCEMEHFLAVYFSEIRLYGTSYLSCADNEMKNVFKLVISMKVFLCQKQAIYKCNMAGKPIVVTRVVDSMTGNLRPTRAKCWIGCNICKSLWES